MANYRMTIQYDGTRYSGWQSQHATDATIQGKLETVEFGKRACAEGGGGVH